MVLKSNQILTSVRLDFISSLIIKLYDDQINNIEYGMRMRSTFWISNMF